MQRLTISSTRIAVALLLSALPMTLTHAQQPPPDPAGTWDGAIEIPGGELGIRVVLEPGDEGWTGTIDIPMQQISKYPLSDVTVDGHAVGFVMNGIPGKPTFEGTLSESGDEISGPFRQSGATLRFALSRADAEAAAAPPPTPARPQEPEGPFPYTSRDVTFDGGGAGVTLAGTILIPEGEGPFPAVAFATGSGPQDRNEALAGHKPFLVVADHLARRGIASLRYDDRGFGDSTGDHMGSTVSDFSDDLRAALTYLRTQPEVTNGAVGLLGHSEGGLMALKVAAGDAPVDFVVLLAPPGEPLPDLLARQMKDLMTAQHVPREQIDQLLEYQQQDLALLRAPDRDTDALRTELEKRFASRIESYSEEARQSLGLTPEAMEQQIRVSLSPWFLSLVQEDPATYLDDLDTPALVLFGELDLQVAAEPSAAVFRKGLETGHCYDVRVLEGLNHLFQHAETGAISEYATIEETFAPEALEIIAGWIEVHGRPKPQPRTGPKPTTDDPPR